MAHAIIWHVAAAAKREVVRAVMVMKNDERTGDRNNVIENR